MFAEGSCTITIGGTKLFCTASIEPNVPKFLKNSRTGWITAEYSMLPRSTHSRTQRDVNRNRPNGRTIEIQRLISRSLRSVVDLVILGERQITIDCDVIQADGGTRTAAITGGFVALYMAISGMLKENRLLTNPFLDDIAAISCGIYKGEAVLDLDYMEDSNAIADGNFVLTGSGKIAEVQTSAEQKPFSYEQFLEMYELAQKGTKELRNKQFEAIDKAGCLIRPLAK